MVPSRRRAANGRGGTSSNVGVGHLVKCGKDAAHIFVDAWAVVQFS